MRAEFREIVSGWMLVDDFDDLTGRIERTAEFTRQHGPLEADEEQTVAMMVQSQIARGIRRGDFEPYLSQGDNEDEEDDDEQEEDTDYESPRLGKCCVCEREDATVRNILMLHFRSPEPGTGCWGCFQCGLPMAGATAVVCDACLEATQGKVTYAVLGAPAENRRIPIEQLTEAFGHDMSKHPGE